MQLPSVPFSLSWVGIPLRSLNIMLKLIRGTSTEAGLKVKVALIERKFLTDLKVFDQEMASLNLVRRKIHLHRNYIIKPRTLSLEKV
jgi:hypothetical protein